MRLLGGASGLGGMRKETQTATDATMQRLQGLSDNPKGNQVGYDSILAPRTEQNTKATANAIIKNAVAANNKRLESFTTAQQKKLESLQRDLEAYSKGVTMPLSFNPENTQKQVELTGYSITSAQRETDYQNKKLQGFQLGQKKEDLEIGRANDIKDPLKEKLNAINAETEGVRSKLLALGQTDFVSNLLKAFGEAQKAIVEVNRSLKDAHRPLLTEQEKYSLRQAVLSKQNATDEEQYKAKLTSTNQAINDRIQSQLVLADAIGKGYEATKQATVQTELMNALGPKLNDEQWRKSHQADIDNLSDQYGRQFESNQSEQALRTLDTLNRQIETEKALQVAHLQGAEAVRQATLAAKAKEIADTHSTEAAKKLIAAEKELSDVQAATHRGDVIQKLQEQTEAQNKLSDAIWKGAEAARQAVLENKYNQIRKDTTGTPEDKEAAVQAERAKDIAEHTARVSDEAAAIVNHYNNQLERLQMILEALKKREASEGKSLELEQAIRDVHKQQLEVEAEKARNSGTLKGGLDAFVLDAQAKMKQPGAILEDGLNSALDKTSDNLAKLFTGQKTHWADEFKSIGENMVKESTKALLQKGIGALGGAFGIGKGAGTPQAKNIDDWSHNPHVKIDNPEDIGKDPTSTNILNPQLPNAFGNLLGGIGGGLGSIMSLIGGAGGAAASTGSALTEAVTSSISFLAGGGDVMPDESVVVGDGGEPEVFTPDRAGTVTPFSKLGSNVSHYYTIDARGAQLGTENRIARSIEAAHNSAVANAVQANEQRKNRTPQRKGS
jgi:hypothetical protein